MAQHSASLAVGGGNCRRFRWIGCLVAVCGMLAGCNLTGTPQLTLGGSERSKPTVNDLVDHIACEVFQAIKTHTIDPLEVVYPRIRQIQKIRNGRPKTLA